MCVPGEPAAPFTNTTAAPFTNTTAAPFTNTAQALTALEGALAFLATTDATALTTVEHADCLRGLQRAESVRIAAQSAVLDAFSEACGHQADGHGTARSWLRWQTRITGQAASAAIAWTRRLAAHPRIKDALAAGTLSESWARQIAEWSDLLPQTGRDPADAILLGAAAAGATLLELAGLAEEMRARTAAPDKDGDDDGADRSLRLDLHYRGAGRLRGDLTPGCAAAVQAVLDALGKKAGPEDTRTQPQRDHDALEEACRRLIAAQNLPDRAGQPTQIQLHMSLDQLLGGLPGSGDASSPGGAQAGRAGPAGASGPQPSRSEIVRRILFPDIEDLTRPLPGAWTGPGALATAGDLCDASIVPVVTGHVDHGLLDKLAGDLLGAIGGAGRPTYPRPEQPASPGQAESPGQAASPGQPGSPAAIRLGAEYARELILRNAVALLSGPGGLASRLRTGCLNGPAASISLPLDVGAATETIPAHLRRAVILRDKHCGFPGCTETNCQVHHIIPRSQGGTTSLDNLHLGCPFHHLIAIHTWGWKVVLNADGTKTAISPDGRRILHSHDPPHVA
jgi:Domain of unknown function (DUF222)/HNH endonuclease